MDFVQYFYADGDFLMFLVRVITVLFCLEFVTGLAYILRGGVHACQ